MVLKIRGFAKSLRKAGIRRADIVLLAGRADPQSYLCLKLLYEIEKNFPDTKVYVYELISQDERPCLRELSGDLGLNYEKVHLARNSYTDYKMALLKIASKYRDPLFVVPFTADDLAEYLISELLLGKLEGLIPDLSFRTAYPLLSISAKEIRLMSCPCRQRRYTHIAGIGIHELKPAKALYEALIKELSKGKLQEKYKKELSKHYIAATSGGTPR